MRLIDYQRESQIIFEIRQETLCTEVLGTLTCHAFSLQLAVLLGLLSDLSAHPKRVYDAS